MDYSLHRHHRSFTKENTIHNTHRNTSHKQKHQEGHAAAVACAAVSRTVQSLLGPHCTMKCIIDKDGTGRLVGDPISLLKHLRVTHPVGSLMLAIARAQKQTIGTVGFSGIDFTLHSRV